MTRVRDSCLSVHLMKEGEKGNPEMCPKYNVNYGKQSEMPTCTSPRNGVQPWKDPPFTKALSGHLKPITLDHRD